MGAKDMESGRCASAQNERRRQYETMSAKLTSLDGRSSSHNCYMEREFDMDSH